MYKSEAEAYQAIRRDWKRRIASAQRAQNMYVWEAINGTKHPAILKAVAYSTNRDPSKVHFPLCSPASCMKEAQVHQDNISKYQNLLNYYKVKEKKDEST